MNTEWIKLDGLGKDEYDKAIHRAAALLRQGGLVAFPTETVYGLGGNAFDDTAARRIYAAKGRPSDNPLIVHISHINMAEALVTHIPSIFRRLAFEFWPGPLTMILPKSDAVPDATTGGLKTVALRMPGHQVALDLIDAAGVPIAAPSANLSGKPSTTRGEHVYHDLAGVVPMILDGGDAEVGLESTIVDLSVPTPVILRPGKIAYEDLKPFAPFLRAAAHPAADDAPRAPGMKYKHYAPTAQVRPFDPAEGDELAAEFARAPGPRALIVTEPGWQMLKTRLAPERLCLLAGDSAEDEAAHRLFDEFRRCDEAGVRTIFVEKFDQHGLGAALMNRIQKAAGETPQQ